MNKKIFLMALMAVTLICVFSLSVGAADTNEFGAVEAIDGIDLTDMNTDGDARVVLVEADGATYHTYPANYIVTNSKALAFDFSRITTATYDKNSIVRFELPKGVTSISGSGCIGSKTGLIEVILGNDLTTIGKEVFNGFTALSSITLGDKVTEIGRYAFNNTAITEIVLPNSVTTLGNNAFQNCKKLVNVTLSESLTEIKYQTFYNCHYLVVTIPDSVVTIGEEAFRNAFYYGGSITINPTSQLKTIGTNAFRDAKQLQSLYLPSTLEAIGSYAFAYTGCTSFENLENTQVTKLENCTFYDTGIYAELRLPKNLTEIGGSAVRLTGKVYVPKTVTTVAANSFYTPWQNGTVIFTGDSADLLKTCTKLANATVIDASEYDEAASYTGFNIVINYNSCKAFNKNVHNLDLSTSSIVYSNGYAAPGVYSVSCIACGEAQRNETKALFACLGYSAPENGSGGIAIGYTVNHQAIADYTDTTGKTLKYGLFAVLKDRIADNDIFASDGSIASGVINAEITRYDFSAFELKIIGFTDEQKDTKLALGAYVCVSDGKATEYSYIQDKTKGELSGKYYFASYNDIVGKAEL